MSRRLSYWFFIAAFPGYFFYHVIKSSVPTPYIGWFSAALILCACVAIPSSFLSSLKNGINRNALKVSSVFYLLITLMLSSIAINAYFNGSEYITNEGTISNILVVIWMVALYEIGRGFDRRNAGTAMFFMTALFLISAIVFHDDSSRTMMMPLLPGDDHEAANYQGMARSVFCTATVLLPFVNGKFKQLALIALSIATLFIIGSRTEVILFSFVAIMFCSLHFGLRFTIILAWVAAIPMIIYVAVSFTEIEAQLTSYLSGDASLSERSEILSAGLNGIYASPIAGDYLGQVRDFGGVGYYIHNALSMWQQYGIVCFVIYCFLFLQSIFVAIQQILSGNRSRHVEALLYLSVACLIGVMTTKSIFWPVPALAFGLAANVLSRSPLRVHALKIAT